MLLGDLKVLASEFTGKIKFCKIPSGSQFPSHSCTAVLLYKSWKLDGLGLSLACWSDLPTYLVVFFRITGVGFKSKVV